MNIGVIGTGYVGLATAVSLSEVGNFVIGFDTNQKQVEQLQQGHPPMHEDNLESMLKSNLQAKRLTFCTILDKQQLECLDVLFICVGTPMQANGACDLSALQQVLTKLISLKIERCTIVIKSTVPVGTTDTFFQTLITALPAQQKHLSITFIPEFLKEGSLVKDMMQPDRIIIGCINNELIKQRMRELYAPFNRKKNKLMFMSIRGAELTKYAANAMLATKISFINEIANIAARADVDIEEVRQGIGADPRIGYDFIYAGSGFGGSCFPKDLNALIHYAQTIDYTPTLLTSVIAVNEQQKQWLITQIQQVFNKNIHNKTFAVWGGAFKPNTSDIRASTAVFIIEALLELGATIQVFDPQAIPNLRQALDKYKKVHFEENNKDTVLQGADALILCTEWKQFWSPDFELIKERLKKAIIFDARNLYNPQQMKSLGIQYFGIGRGQFLEHNKENK